MQRICPSLNAFVFIGLTYFCRNFFFNILKELPVPLRICRCLFVLSKKEVRILLTHHRLEGGILNKALLFYGDYWICIYRSFGVLKLDLFSVGINK
jgi:hypothetical protein